MCHLSYTIPYIFIHSCPVLLISILFIAILTYSVLSLISSIKKIILLKHLRYKRSTSNYMYLRQTHTVNLVSPIISHLCELFFL